MPQFITIVLTTIVVINNLRICQASIYTYANNNVKEDYRPQTAATAPATSATALHYFKVNDNDDAIENKEQQNKLKFHHQHEKNVLHQENIAKYPIYHPSKLYTSVDYNLEHDNDVDDAYNNKPIQQLQQLPPPPQQQFQFEQLHDNFAYSQQHERPYLLIKQLQSQHQELSEGYAAFLHEPYQVVAPPKSDSGSSNDHQQQRQYLTTYVTPAPPPPPSTNIKTHLNLHHHQNSNNNYNNNNINKINKPTIVSYATGGNDASPTSTTTSINSKNLLQYGVKYVTNNDLNSAYDNTNIEFKRKPALEYGQPGPLPGSQQYVYAPMRSSVDRKLQYTSKTFPYPPSFISLTTTEKPITYYYPLNHKAVYKKIPDFFSHRQSKSLLDSYIPSWQITKLLQQYESKPGLQSIKNNNNNLHTLAFVMPYKNYYKRELNKGKK